MTMRILENKMKIRLKGTFIMGRLFWMVFADGYKYLGLVADIENALILVKDDEEYELRLVNENR